MFNKKQVKKSQVSLGQHVVNNEDAHLLNLNKENLQILFKKCHDVQFSTFNFHNHRVTFFYCVGLINFDFIYQTIPLFLEKFFSELTGVLSSDSILEGLHLPTLSTINNKDDAISDIFAGKLLIDFGINGTIFTVDISDRPQRNPEETKTESTINGPRDNFIEDIGINISLIRKRLRTTSLVFDQYEIGTRTRTKIALLYMDDIVNKNTLTAIKEKLFRINVDGLFTGVQLEELINDSPYALFPRHKYTGKPDFAVETLLSGRFVILIDGVATAYVTPINFFFLLKSSEDLEITYLYSSFERLIRISGMLISSYLPGAWIALTTFHQDQLPLSLLATVVETRRGVPFPASIEAISMLLLFDLFREAGVRLPMAIGQILSVVGGLIIGDAAISSGLTSPSMLVVIALSTISTFTLSDQSLIGTLSIIRFFSILLASLFGFFGLLLSFYFICSYIGNIKVFGVPYLYDINKINIASLLKTFVRLPYSKMHSRPDDLGLNDNTRKGK